MINIDWNLIKSLVGRSLIFIFNFMGLEMDISKLFYSDSDVIKNIIISIGKGGISYEKDLNKVRLYIDIINATDFTYIEVNYLKARINSIAQQTSSPSVLKKGEGPIPFEFVFSLNEAEAKKIENIRKTKDNLRINVNGIFFYNKRRFKKGEVLLTTL